MLRTRLLGLAIPLVALALLPAGAAAQAKSKAEELRQLEKQNTEAARTCITEFNKALKGAKTPEDIATAMRTLNVRHSTIINKLVRFLQASGDPVITEAVTGMLVEIDDPRCVPSLNQILLTKLAKSKDNVEVCVSLLKAIGHFGDPKSGPAVAKAVSENVIPVATAACDAASKVPDPRVVDALIKLLGVAEQTENAYIPNNAGGAGGNYISGPNMKKALKEPSQRALRALTNQPYSGAREFKKWWAANRMKWMREQREKQKAAQ
jgi:HEAT repeat protein